MKKLAVIILALAAMIALGMCSDALGLGEIADQFNNDDYILSTGLDIKASADDTKLTICINGNDYVLDYVLDGDILTGSFDGDNCFAGAYYSMYIADIIETSMGYEKGEYLLYMNAPDFMNFTVEENGIGIVSDENSYTIKIDMSRKADSIDLSGIYGTVEDFAGSSEFLREGSVSNRFGNVWFYKYDDDGKYIIYIAERNGLTDCSYKTLQSVIEVMFGADTAADFAANCPDLSEDRSFGTYNLYIHPEIDEFVASFAPDSSHEFIEFTAENPDYYNFDNDFGDDFGDEEIIYDGYNDEVSSDAMEGESDVMDEKTEDTSMILPAVIICGAAVIVIAAAAVIISKRRK